MQINHIEDYQALRAREYPKAEVLADALYWQSRGDRSKMDAYVAACSAVKAKYPTRIDIGLPAVISEAIIQVDALADAARTLVVGDPVRVKEYEMALTEATAYKNAGYTGTVPRTVDAWARAKTWTPQQAADDILVASGKWYEILYRLRDLRLNAKEALKIQTTEADVAVLFNTYQNNIRLLMSQM